MKTSPPPANAHPAWTHTGSTTIRKISYYTVAVSDSDGMNETNVYTASSSSSRIYGETWSSSGGSISFIEGNAINAVDVTVTNGVPTGSNSRTIYTPASGVTVKAQAWSQASTVAEIAFVTKDASGYEVYTVSTSGGTATKIFSAATGDIMGAGITWSNDGTQLAFVYVSGTTVSIKVIDATTGAVNATLASGSGYASIWSPIVWSHSGEDKICFSATTVAGGSTATYNLYTIGVTAGSTETKVISGYNAFWSPNNSELVYTDESNNVTTKVTVGTGATTTVGTGTPYGDWK